MWTAISALSCRERPARSSIWPVVSCTLTQRSEVPRDLSSSTPELWPRKFPCEQPYNEQVHGRCVLQLALSRPLDKGALQHALCNRLIQAKAARQLTCTQVVVSNSAPV